MRKLLVVLMVVAFAATAFAADFKVSGEFEVKGIYLDNRDLAKSKTSTEGWWEQDGNIVLKVIVDKDTTFTVRGDFRDGTWGTDEMQAKKPGKTSNTGGTDESGFTVQRAYIDHNFGPAILSAGLMSTGGWGTAFDNDVEGNYRVKLVVPMAAGKLTFQTTKNYEGSNNTSYNYRNPNKDDNDQYGVDFVGKVEKINYGANLTYRVNSTVNNGYAAKKVNGWAMPNDNGSIPSKGDSDSIDTLKLNLFVSGSAGIFGYESEFVYQNVTSDVKHPLEGKDYDLYAFYGAGFATVDKLTAGLAFMYSSVDKKTGQAINYGDDFNSTFIVDEIGGPTGGDDLQGFTTFKLFADYAVNDKLTTGAAFAYALSNYNNKDYSAKYSNAINQKNFKDIKLYELDAYVAYQINKSLTYTVKAAYLQADDILSGPAKYNADPVYYASHALNFAF